MMLSKIATDYLFFVGLLAGVLIFPLARLLLAGGLGGFIEACARYAGAPFALIGRLFRRGADLRHAGNRIKATMLRTHPHEEQIKASTLTLRNVLMSLAVVIQRTDQAASSSNQTLGDVRDTIGRMNLPQDLREVHSLLMREIDRMVSGNLSLKKELSRSQENLASQRQLIEELRSAVRLDGLTQLANRSYFDEKLLEMIKIHHRHNDVFSLLLVDVDNFKEINDRYGHQAGDRILKGVAFNLRNALRESDFVARFGGDEFAIILFRSSGRYALEVAQKLCTAQQESNFLLDGANIQVTLSIGAAEVVAGDTVETLVKRADQALYRVKSEGRNGVRYQ
jgi:diguanylate cyclase